MSLENISTPASGRRLAQHDQVDFEFEQFWQVTDKQRLESPVSQRAILAAAHRLGACLNYLSNSMKVKSADIHEQIFFQEMTSDAIHLVHALAGGDARSGRFYLRSVIENFWRHHYFRDHPVEFDWLQCRENYVLEITSLREHCQHLRCFNGPLSLLFSDLPRLHAQLSAEVHSNSSKTATLRSTLADIKLLESQGISIQEEITAVLHTVLALSIFSESESFLALHVNVQKFLITTLSQDKIESVTNAFAEDDITSFQNIVGLYSKDEEQVFPFDMNTPTSSKKETHEFSIEDSDSSYTQDSRK